MLKKLMALAALAATPAFAEPVEQTNFTTFVKSYHDRYLTTGNELLKSEMPRKRGEDLRHALGGMKFEAWELIVVSVNIDKRSHKVWVALANASPSPDFIFMNLPLFADDKPAFGLSGALLDVARTLDTGDRVVADGMLWPQPNNPLMDYDSLGGREAASMQLPKFAATFSSIKKVEPITGVLPPTRPDQALSTPSLPAR